MKHTRAYPSGRKQGVVYKKLYPKLYNSWRAMRSRCNNKEQHDYKYYGGRGIKCTEEWRIFKNFLQWALDNGYEEGLTIDRIDCFSDYTPSNCRWITHSENVARSNTYRATEEYKRKTKDMSEEVELPTYWKD